MSLPLSGITVLDLTHVLAGPFCTQIMGDLGAEVIKIERPGVGDQTRRMPPHFIGKKKQSAYFLAINRNKKSLTLDLKSPEGKEIFYGLTKKADVVINNFTPGTMEKLGLGYETLKKINPGIVWASITGYGLTGPYRDRPTYDIIVQAVGGLMSYTGEPDGPPVRSGIPFGDLGAAGHAIIGILAALLSRSKTGEGRKVDVGMLDVQISLHTYRAKYYLVAGEIPRPVGTGHVSSVPLRAYRTKDSYIVIEAFMDHFWRNLCRAIGMESLADDPRFNSRSKRLENREEVDRILEEAFLKKTTDEWIEIFDEIEVPSGPINTLDKALADPQVLSRNMIIEIDSPHTGKLKDVGNPIKISGVDEEIFNPPPLLGEHTEMILKNMLGYSTKKIAELKEKDII
ncbi:MAG: CoA transferase [Desulfobacteraceae bacterium]|jgi:crotonobetainyl-CoA:carnitine CoA-transferase CaiB-like acyl-CoA transferase|nr:CoA transferase [Desulfobacteraceae bacterium]